MALLDFSQCLTIARLALAADDTVAPSADHKFPVWLRRRLSESLAALAATDVAADGAEGARAESSRRVQTAYAEGMALIREVNAFLSGLPRTLDIAAIKTRYGLAGGVGKGFAQGKIEATLREFLSVTATPDLPSDARLRATTVTAIQAVLTTIDTHKPKAQRGTRQQATAEKQAALRACRDAISRTRSYLDAALPLGPTDPSLPDYGFTPRQRSF